MDAGFPATEDCAVNEPAEESSRTTSNSGEERACAQ
jgi:hypothetical protein